MEETNQNIKEEVKTPSPEEFTNVIIQQQNRIKELEGQLKAVDVVAFRLGMLFRILDYEKHFNKEFINYCTSDIEKIMKVPEPETLVNGTNESE